MPDAASSQAMASSTSTHLHPSSGMAAKTSAGQLAPATLFPVRSPGRFNMWKSGLAFGSGARGTLGVVRRPSSLFGFLRRDPSCLRPGKTTTRCCSGPRAPDVFDFKMFIHGEFLERLGRRASADSLTRVLYPGDYSTMRGSPALRAEYFLVACSRGPRAALPPSTSGCSALPEGRHPAHDTHTSLAVV